MNTNLNWHLVYTKPGMEKRVALLLEQKGLKTFLPTFKTSVRLGNQVNSCQKPLFSSWVFVQCTKDELTSIKRTKGVVSLLYWLSKPVVISEAEVNILHFVLKNFDRINVIKTGLQPAENPLPIEGSKLAFPLPSLGYCLLAGERTTPESPDPSVRIVLDGNVSRLAYVKESFAYLVSHFPSLTAPKRQSDQTETSR